MNPGFLYDLLIDPVTREPLSPDDTGAVVTTPDGKITYPVIDQVPQVVVVNNGVTIMSDVHRNYGTGFSYHDHYQADAELFDYSENDESAATRHEIRRVHESILREISGKDRLVLDVGCGNGWAAGYLVPKGHRVVSMDISTKNPVDSLKRTESVNHAAVTADVFNMPFRDGAFDYIIASEVMEHVADPVLFVSCLLKVLKKDGKIIITTPYNEKIEYCLCVHCNRMTPLHAHLHSFSEKNVLQLMPSSGATYSTQRFSSRYLARLRTHVVLRYFGFGVWRLIDRAFIFLSGGPMRFKIVITSKICQTDY